MSEKKVIFILGSGRCGTHSFFKALNNFKQIESHHEFFFEPTLRIATSYHMNKISKTNVKKFIIENHLFSVNNSEKKIWVNSCNALPWLTKVLIEIFPQAKFLHLVRNGKKVVSSFYNKFNDEMYKHINILKLINFLEGNKSAKISSEKKYWRPIPFDDKEELNKFIKLGQFYRICKYWSDINFKIEENLKLTDKKYFFKFEDISSRKKSLELTNFLEIRKKDINQFYDSFKKPMNVRIPKNFMMNNSQKKIFNKICGDQMLKYNYGEEEYEVEY